MSSALNQRVAAALSSFIDKHRRWVVVLGVLAVALLGSGIRHLEFTNNYRVFFSEKNPELIAFEAFQDTYTKTDNILFVIRPAEDRIFTPRILAAVEDLTEKAWRLPFASRVDSVTNFQYTWADGDDLTVEDLIRNGAELKPTELARREAVALADPLLAANLLSLDGRTAGVNVTLQYPQQSLTEVPTAVAAARALADELRAVHPDVTVALAGMSMLNNAFSEAGQIDAFTLMPLMFLVLLVVTVISLRSVTGALATFTVIVLSAVSGLGFAGFAGIKLSPPSVTAPVIIMTLAIADSIHVLLSMQSAMRDGLAKVDALRRALRLNLIPVTVTSLTTIVGFLSLNYGDAPPFWHLGNITAVGVLAAWLLSLTVLPALVLMLPFRAPTAIGAEQRLMNRLADFVLRHHRRLLPAGAVVALCLVAAVPTLQLDDDWVRYFDHRIDFRRDAEFTDEHLSGIFAIEYSLRAGEAEGISRPEYLAGLEQFTEWLRAQPDVSHVYSHADVMKKLNKNMHGDDEEWYRLPQDRRLAAQYLLLYELSLPFGLDLNDRVSIDKSETRVTARLHDLTTAEVRSFLAKSEDFLAAEGLDGEPTGPTSMFSFISKRNVESMVKGNVIAVLLISLVMILSLRSLGLGLLSLLPNVIPIAMTFGIWALVNGQVGLASAMVSVSSLGIVVDDTVHFLSKYLFARRDEGQSREEAVRHAIVSVGRPIIATTVIVGMGFLVLAASTFQINFQLGLLTAIAIVLALFTDLFLLPSLLLAGRTSKK